MKISKICKIHNWHNFLDEVLKNASTLISDYTDDDEDDDDLREENKDESSGDKLLMF